MAKQELQSSKSTLQKKTIRLHTHFISWNNIFSTIFRSTIQRGGGGGVGRGWVGQQETNQTAHTTSSTHPLHERSALFSQINKSDTSIPITRVSPHGLVIHGADVPVLLRLALIFFFLANFLSKSLTLPVKFDMTFTCSLPASIRVYITSLNFSFSSLSFKLLFIALPCSVLNNSLTVVVTGANPFSA